MVVVVAMRWRRCTQLDGGPTLGAVIPVLGRMMMRLAVCECIPWGRQRRGCGEEGREDSGGK